MIIFRQSSYPGLGLWLVHSLKAVNEAWARVQRSSSRLQDTVAIMRTSRCKFSLLGVSKGISS